MKTYDEMIQHLVQSGEHPAARLNREHKASLTAALMDKVAEPLRPAFITDSPLATRYPELLSQALQEIITPEELGQAIIDGAIYYATARLERDLQSPCRHTLTRRSPCRP